jgi:hypothetical protein
MIASPFSVRTVFFTLETLLAKAPNAPLDVKIGLHRP